MASIKIQKIIIIIFSILTGITLQATQCEYGNKDSCPTGFTCINFDKDIAKCVENYSGSLKSIPSPFEKSTRFFCDQGPLSPKGNSHTWLNTGHAVDFKSYDYSSTAKLLAVEAGEVISFAECTTHNDQCGAGFGNQVKILTDDGLMYFYAHLSKVIVKTGERVLAGQHIGNEGMTGWTGLNNPHLHFSVHYDWRNSSKEKWKNVGWLPPSVPFEINICKSKEEECDCKSEKISNFQLSCKRSSHLETTYCGGK